MAWSGWGIHRPCCCEYPQNGCIFYDHGTPYLPLSSSLSITGDFFRATVVVTNECVPGSTSTIPDKVYGFECGQFEEQDIVLPTSLGIDSEPEPCAWSTGDVSNNTLVQSLPYNLINCADGTSVGATVDWEIYGTLSVSRVPNLDSSGQEHTEEFNVFIGLGTRVGDRSARVRYEGVIPIAQAGEFTITGANSPASMSGGGSSFCFHANLATLSVTVTNGV